MGDDRSDEGIVTDQLGVVTLGWFLSLRPLAVAKYNGQSLCNEDSCSRVVAVVSRPERSETSHKMGNAKVAQKRVKRDSGQYTCIVVWVLGIIKCNQ